MFTVENRCISNQLNVLTAKNGQISSSTLDRKGCGSSKSPWIISASPGQTINIDIIDFDVSQQDYNLISCRSVYGFILERSLGINHTICGGHTRERALYTSKTNSVEINILQKESRGEAHFLLRYSGENIWLSFMMYNKDYVIKKLSNKNAEILSTQ